MLHVRELFPKNVFELMGKNENSATFALAWTLEQSPRLARILCSKIFSGRIPEPEPEIQVQAHGKDKGFTDIEIRWGDEFHVVIEAKVGWVPAGKGQLLRYKSRFNLEKLQASNVALVSVSAATESIARTRLVEEIEGIQVKHLSWGALRMLAKQAHAVVTTYEEKLWLRQLTDHLSSYAAMNRVRDNKVYVVSLGSGPMKKGGKETWIDVVVKDGRYFHPVGNHWPAQPPNYIGFRYKGQLQSVHRIEKFEVVTDVSEINESWVKTSRAHFVYVLGPAIRPAKKLEAGTNADSVKQSARVWCAIDTLLSGEFDTLGEARDATKKRDKLAESEQF